MPPIDLFSSSEFWTAVIVALVGGGGVGAIIGATLTITPRPHPGS